VKTLAILTAAFAISLACAVTASAQTSSITVRRNADGSESVTKSVSDAFGDRKSITKRRNA
jgi:hypothetical protein